MGEGVPQKMGGDADEDGEQHERELERIADRIVLRATDEAEAQWIGQQEDCGLLDDVLERPEDCEGDGQVELERPAPGMAEVISREGVDQILEVGHEAADDHRREDQPGAAEGQRGGGVSEGEGHSSIMRSCVLRGGGSYNAQDEFTER